MTSRLIWCPDHHGIDRWHAVESRSDVVIGIVRQIKGKLAYDTTGYVAAHVRPATESEINEWRAR